MTLQVDYMYTVIRTTNISWNYVIVTIYGCKGQGATAPIVILKEYQ